jgi:SagB-type dehydrogenase family enzyme
MSKGIGHKFMQETQYRHMETPDQDKGLPQPPLELPADAACTTIALPTPAGLSVPGLDLRAALESRRSLRAYTEQPLTLDELSWLLWSTQGVQKVISRPATVRPVPSAGARHAFETYILANRVDGLAPGVYRFLALEHKLQTFNQAPDIADRITEAAYNQEFVGQSAATFIWVAVLYRMAWRYGERGYRYLLLDAGHVCQNLYLAAEPIDCGVCAIAAFYDEKMNSVLGLDGEQQFVVYMATVGKKK